MICDILLLSSVKHTTRMMSLLHLRHLLHQGVGEVDALDEIVEALNVEHVQDQATESVLTPQGT